MQRSSEDIPCVCLLCCEQKRSSEDIPCVCSYVANRSEQRRYTIASLHSRSNKVHTEEIFLTWFAATLLAVGQMNIVSKVEIVSNNECSNTHSLIHVEDE